MYGLVLQNMRDCIVKSYGLDTWNETRHQCAIKESSFDICRKYSEEYVPRIADTVTQMLDIDENVFFENVGSHFVDFLQPHGYDQVLSVLGRSFRDFLNSLDDLHEYMKMSYSKLKAPSFMCENETKDGLRLHYRSRRRRLTYYAIGIIKKVAKVYYSKEIVVQVESEEVMNDLVHVTLSLSFDNFELGLAQQFSVNCKRHLPISPGYFLEIFPFAVIFSRDMTVRYIGQSLQLLLPKAVGKKMTDTFKIVRPIVPATFSKILDRVNAVFEMKSFGPVQSIRCKDETLLALSGRHLDLVLTLRGQMIHLKNWQMMAYLGTPVMPNLDCIIDMGLYINDLSMHDFSRDIMLAGTQQTVQLRLALEQEQEKTKKIEESMVLLDKEMERTNKLLYQMIPEQIAERLRAGECPVETCEMFSSVSILLSDIVKFTEICSKLSPMDVVNMLNKMYSIFDGLTEVHGVCKVETIGDAYMVVSGTLQENDHVKRAADMALDVLEGVKTLKDPRTGQHPRIRIGIHTGPAVAGIVGVKMPRYCLFGKSVAVASLLESSSEPMMIQISEATSDQLTADYCVCPRGEIELSRNEKIRTYWLKRKIGNISSFPVDNPSNTPEAAHGNKSPLESPFRFREIISGNRVKCTII